MIKEKLKIAFDVQGTLVGAETKEDELAMIYLLKRLKKTGHYIIVWSGDNKDAVEKIVSELEITEYVDERSSKLGRELPDIAFDDKPFPLAKLIAIKV